MTLSDVIERAGNIIGLEGEPTSYPTSAYNKLKDSAVTVYTELITEHVPLRTKEAVSVSNGKIFYEDLGKKVREILKISTGAGRLKFTVYPEYIETECGYSGDAEIEYLYYYVPCLPTDEMLLPPQYTEYILAVGTAAEYFYRSSLIDEAMFFRNRFESAVNNLSRTKRVFNLPYRRLI